MTERVIRRRNRPNAYADDMLLDAAEQAFCRDGFRGTSMADIAAEAWVGRTTLYERFGSKKALYDRTMERVAESLLADIRGAYESVEDVSLEVATQRPVRAFYDWVRSNPSGFQLLFSGEQGAPTGVDHRDRALTELTELIAGGMVRFLRAHNLPSTRVTDLAAAIAVGVLDHGARWAVDNSALEGRIDVADLITTFVFGGLSNVMSPEARRRRARNARAA